ncbi:hypothetical protein OPKNFCMD_6667 [Methylobacterium crusticola]|uniref:histidine kinase n=1 Tax=Methylobacterium crusticola TaxID=1697972 RepID=A0ABQ4R831_9HYPH|nr:PAS domain-containing protein [Methylobacterium crusticola]GJD53888.1 hypothetical protein OPKNFCMD_6667 [Methylobacterium crusticola]
MIWAADKQGQVAYVCAEWHEATGQPAEQARGSGWLEVVHPKDRPLAEQTFMSAVAQATSYTMVYRLRTADGSYTWVKDCAMPSFCPNSFELLGYLGSVTQADQVEFERAEAEGHLEAFDPGKPIPAFEPISSFDQAADYLILALSAARRSQDEVLVQMIEICLFQVGRLLTQALNETDGLQRH